MVPGYAKTAETLIVFELKNSHGKLMDKDVVILQEGSVMVNREKLSATEIITQSEHITAIASFTSNGTVRACDAGTFKHILKKGKILKSESGCLGSERYNFLKENFKALKKDRITE